MQTERKVFEKLFSPDKVELESQKFELALADDFKAIFNKANNDQAKIATRFVDALAKASNEFKANLADWNKAQLLGNQLIQQSKQIGVELPAPFLNSVKSSEIEVKKMPLLLYKIALLYKEF
jgi:hypothetical protein